MQTEFQGLGELTAVLDRAVTADDPALITASVKDGLCRLVEARALELPTEAVRPKVDGYARRLLYASDRFDYTIVAMTWGPGQGTALHDHAGIWCVECVCEGQIEVVQYDLLDQSGDRFRFAAQDTVIASTGTGGTLIPPFEYHTIRNVLPSASSVTLHVYGGEMDRCAIFEPLAEGWYRRTTKSLQYDN